MVRNSSKQRSIALLVLLAGASYGCSSPTPDGTLLFSQTFEVGTPKDVTKRVDLDGGGALTLTIGVLEFEGARSLATVRGSVESHGGWTYDSLGSGEPVNIGTSEAPIMSVPFMIERSKKTPLKTEVRQTSVTISADGEVNVQ